MAYVELIIKIPEEVKNRLCFGVTYQKDIQTVCEALNHCTLLPKGHGKLKDFDKIEWYGCDLEGRGCIEAKGDCSVCNHANCYAKQVRELPTIIEADTESEE